MSALSPFDSASIAGVIVEPPFFTPGSAELSISGIDKSMAALDGSFLRVRVSILKRASFRAIGDWSRLASPCGEAVPILLFSNGETMASFDAAASASYDAKSGSSFISLTGSPEPL